LQQSLQLNRSTCGHRACETEQLVQANDEKMSKKSTLSEFSENGERSELLFSPLSSCIRNAAAISSGAIEN
jgi:hypothetical protein